MQLTLHFHPQLRHATVPTYVASYFFPMLILVYEVYRIAYWLINYGPNFAIFKEMGYEFILMVGLFATQVAVEFVFLFLAWAGGRPDFEQRLTNVILGFFLSMVVLAFDFTLQMLQ